ncbi:NUDIX domain-containing protein [Pseudomonas sp. KnCO4]|uniref:NUDIX domain-containing protein n=1 Tax=Pseudomonas sp. KnCO4 TaxID=3381355 RepID=UPI0038784178
MRRKDAKWEFPSGLLASGEAPLVAAAREIWKELSLHCPGLSAVGTFEVGNVLYHVFKTCLTEDCNVVLGRGIVACKWVDCEELTATMLKPAAAALLSRDLSALVHSDEPAASSLAADANIRPERL